MRSRTASFLLALALLATSTAALVASSASATATTYAPEAPVLDTVTGGPWNTSQGDADAGEPYPFSDLLPTFTPGGSETTLGGVDEPNVAVYPNEKEPTVAPYPSGVAGTPGPLDGYCTSLGANPETGSPVPQPAGSTLPMSPYYFPDVVRNGDGSLTGYFDYRPKDAEEAVTVARSTDDGKSWSSEGEALGENSGYCPTADATDNGQGHPFVMSVDGATDLYTLQRPAGDNNGVGLLVHAVSPTAADPLAGLPSDQPVGVDPNTFATGETSVPTSGEGVSIPVSTLGSQGSPEDIVAGPYEDADAPSPSGAIITCKGTSSGPPAALTQCTVAASEALTVHTSDDLLQVIATANPEKLGSKTIEKGATYTVPAGPNKPSTEGGLETLKILGANEVVSPFTTFLMNVNAPNRVYVDGVTVNCTQANANPTTKLEFCTTQDGAPLTVHQGDAITADPIVPPNTSVTSGLEAPDGIVGTLPRYQGAPEGSTVVLYTQKLLNYFIVGTTDGAVNSKGEFKEGKLTLPAATINYKPSVAAAEPLPAGGTFTISVGSNNVTSKAAEPIQKLTCTGTATPAPSQKAPAGSVNLLGCTGGTGEVAEGNWIGGPNAATVPFEVLTKIGEGKNGKTSGPEKLFGNNEDLTVLRAAYTFNGVEFHDLGAISGTTSGTGNDSGEYNDVSNPFQTATPSATSPSNLRAGEADTTELRFVGSRGTIITNPDGSFGMFLSGSWATDGDSDAFNQIFYTESSNGREWSVPKVVLSTEYEFAASAEQDKSMEEGKNEPLGISAYYSGRAYGPAVVQNPDGSLTMVFAGYRLPKPIEPVGTKVGIGPAQYTVGSKDPALYRDILTMRLTSSTSPGVATTTSVASSDDGTGMVGAPVTYTATVRPVAPGTGTPTGSVSFSTASGPISECGAQPLSLGTPDTATCTTTHGGAGGSEEITAKYSGDANYATSTESTTETIDEAATITSPAEATFAEGTQGSFTVTAEGAPAPVIAESGALPAGLTFDPITDELAGTATETGLFPITFTAFNGVGAEAMQSFALTVLGFHITTGSLPPATPGTAYSEQLEAAGGVTPYTWHKASGRLPHGLTVSPSGLLAGTVSAKVKAGSFTFKVSVTDSMSRHHEKATATFTLDVS